MSGHSKWNNIKNRKDAQDKKKGAVFSQLAKVIKTAVKEGRSGNPDDNPSLRLILEKAKAANMPKENIKRAIDRGLGKTAAGVTLQEIVYEAFGPGGAPLMIAAVTDNRNRTAAELKFILNKFAGSLASPGAAAYMFTRQGEEYVRQLPDFVTDETTRENLQNLIEALRENDDVEDVYA